MRPVVAGFDPAFLPERVVIDVRYRQKAEWIYEDYQAWCRAEGIPCASVTALGRALREAGAKKFRRADGNYWGVRLR